MRILMIGLVGLVLGCGDGDRSVGPAVKLVDSTVAAVTDTSAQSVSLSAMEKRFALKDLGIDYTANAFVSAAYAGDLVVVRLFVETGMSVGTANSRGGTAMSAAISAGQMAVVRYLIDQGASVGGTDLLVAVRGNSFEMVEFLVEQGADVNAAGSDGYTALHFAASEGLLELAQYLIGQGADMNAREINGGRTALHEAARLGHLDLVRLLVDQGASVWARNDADRTPRDVAAQYGHTEIVEYLDSLAEDE